MIDDIIDQKLITKVETTQTERFQFSAGSHQFEGKPCNQNTRTYSERERVHVPI